MIVISTLKLFKKLYNFLSPDSLDFISIFSFLLSNFCQYMRFKSVLLFMIPALSTPRLGRFQNYDNKNQIHL